LLGNVPVASREKARLLVLVADRAEVGTNNFKVCVLSDVVLGHFEHAEVEVCDRAEGAACHQYDGCFGRVSEGATEAMVGEGIVWGIGERFCEVDAGLSHLSGGGGVWKLEGTPPKSH
jgi:hypothetical protein